jgi:hypothetical protein
MFKNVKNDELSLHLIEQKCYVQLKVTFEYFYDKPHEPTFKTIQVPFSIDKLIDRSNLAQSIEDVKRIMEAQTLQILQLMDKFEHQGSNWVIVCPVSYKVRLVKFKDPYIRGTGFIPTPEWLENRKAIINIKNTDENCSYKCLYRFFNRDRKIDKS